jgi:hypothetical protein
MARRFRRVVAVATAAALASGCTAVAERATESAIGRMGDGDVDIDLSEGRMTVEGEDGASASFGSSSEVPDRVAKLVPLPDGYEPVSTFEQSDGDQDAVTVVGVVHDGGDPADVVDALEEAMTTDGWERMNRTSFDGELVSVTMERGATTVNLAVTADDGSPGLTVVLVEGEEG